MTTLSVPPEFEKYVFVPKDILHNLMFAARTILDLHILDENEIDDYVRIYRRSLVAALKKAEEYCGH